MPDYTVLSIVPLNYYDPQLQEAVPSHQVTARWEASKSVIRVVIPDASYNATEVDTAIRQAGATDEQVKALGASSVRGR